MFQGASCKFYFKVQQKLGTQAKLREYGYNTAWDIEDLVNLGKTVKVQWDCENYVIMNNNQMH